MVGFFMDGGNNVTLAESLLPPSMPQGIEFMYYNNRSGFSNQYDPSRDILGGQHSGRHCVSQAFDEQ